MNHDPKKQYAFKRLETDEEFRARLAKAGMITLFFFDDELDAVAWKEKKMQRRIVEGEA